MNSDLKELIQKKERILKLLFDVNCYEVDKFFDIESELLLDEKIEVLEALKAGKTIGEIPNFYNILELMPKDGIWD